MIAVHQMIALLRDPSVAQTVAAGDWTSIIRVARAESLLGTLAYRLADQELPPAVAALLADARAAADAAQVQALWEADMCVRALAHIGVTPILLKGTAYAAGGLAAAKGRQIGDLDILVPRDRLDDVETALLNAGWEWLKSDPYDDAYYRDHMHELPPMMHAERDRMIDVHHTILPLTHRARPDAAALIGDATPLPFRREAADTSPLPFRREAADTSPLPFRGGAANTSPLPFRGGAANTSPLPFRGGAGGGASRHKLDFDSPHPNRSCSATPLAPPKAEGLYALSPADRIIHCAAHLIADGDLAGGLRNLWDLHCLLTACDDWDMLQARAQRHQLLPAVQRGAWLAHDVYGTMLPKTWDRWNRQDTWYLMRLTARDDWGRETRPFIRLMFYIRSHWMRMPPLMLARHLWTKWRKENMRKK
jgi:hypothetical protein